jgi:N-methylhydantoinase A
VTRYRVSMDIGGTFTDVVAYDEERGTYAAGKSSTTRASGTRERKTTIPSTAVRDIV